MDEEVKRMFHRILVENVPDSFYIGYRDRAQKEIFVCVLYHTGRGVFVNARAKLFE